MGKVLDYYGVAHTGRKQQKVKCPVHGEHEPSCSIDLEKGVYICFACGSKGSAMTLIQEMENCDRRDAIRFAIKNKLIDGDTDNAPVYPKGRAGKTWVPPWSQ